MNLGADIFDRMQTYVSAKGRSINAYIVPLFVELAIRLFARIFNLGEG
jgi:hypothetical protein